ncbi:hypothetical protein [Luteolibacter marinus]|uniref:hypothetical protein n=1 Tax=Luteolibacter marinus TaxID=2776705 RepID=UPI0018694740|nr:hypothetical protein [Luteolibacter marinus]
MKDLILGNHLLFARAGDVIDGVTVGAEARPDTDPAANFTKLPTVEDWEPKIDRNIIKRRAPSPGKYRDRKSIVLNQTMTHAFSLQEWTEMTFAELLLGGNKPVGGVFVPGEREELVTGWWIVQGYAQNNQQIVALNIYGEATIGSYKFGERLDPYALVITELYSSISTGQVLNLD